MGGEGFYKKLYSYCNQPKTLDEAGSDTQCNPQNQLKDLFKKIRDDQLTNETNFDNLISDATSALTTISQNYSQCLGNKNSITFGIFSLLLTPEIASSINQNIIQNIRAQIKNNNVQGANLIKSLEACQIGHLANNYMQLKCNPSSVANAVGTSAQNMPGILKTKKLYGAFESIKELIEKAQNLPDDFDPATTPTNITQTFIENVGCPDGSSGVAKAVAVNQSNIINICDKFNSIDELVGSMATAEKYDKNRIIEEAKKMHGIYKAYLTSLFKMNAPKDFNSNSCPNDNTQIISILDKRTTYSACDLLGIYNLAYKSTELPQAFATSEELYKNNIDLLQGRDKALENQIISGIESLLTGAAKKDMDAMCLPLNCFSKSSAGEDLISRAYSSPQATGRINAATQFRDNRFKMLMKPEDFIKHCKRDKTSCDFKCGHAHSSTGTKNPNTNSIPPDAVR
jgi:hypothetical protein